MTSFMETAERLAELLERFDLSGMVYRLENIEAVCRATEERLDTLAERLAEVQARIESIDGDTSDTRCTVEDMASDVKHMVTDAYSIEEIAEDVRRNERLGWLRDAREAMAKTKLVDDEDYAF
jgi:methyl-accepting chemotaxis protein